MKKEIIISVVVIALVVILNVITMNYTKDSVEVISEKLNNIKDEISNGDGVEHLANDVVELKNEWETRFNKLAYYIEHDELEKVDLYIVGLESNVNTEEYSQAIAELDKCVYILEHIQDKYSFDLKNIF